MSTSTVGTIFTAMTTAVSQILEANLPLIIAIVAGLFGVLLLVRLGKRLIGGR